MKRSSPTPAAGPRNRPIRIYNLGWPGEGVIVVLSWAGQWATQFNRDDSGGVRVRGGQELTHFRLHPGEEVRGPMVVLQFYRGDWLRAQNIWRRWMLAHNLPRPYGKPVHAAIGRVQLAPVRGDDQRQHRQPESSSSTATARRS